MIPDRDIFSEILSEHLGKEVEVSSVKNLSGGCISNAVKVETATGNFFVKFNYTKDVRMFETEGKGLELLRKAGAVRIPEVAAVGQREDFCYLVLEFIERGPQKRDYWERLGASLAALHKVTDPRFGLPYDNYIGALPQKNSPSPSWTDFFISQRLNVQVKLALDSGRISESVVHKMEDLYKRLPELLAEESPALLHGDLWSGNVMVGDRGEPVLIDPAVYFGHREAELAFTTLFGGFDEGFYKSYHDHFPLQKGYEDRFDIYNLYPLLVHVNMFGASYLSSVLSILGKYVA